jgi:hypothetical protein
MKTEEKARPFGTLAGFPAKTLTSNEVESFNHSPSTEPQLSNVSNEDGFLLELESRDPWASPNENLSTSFNHVFEIVGSHLQTELDEPQLRRMVEDDLSRILSSGGFFRLRGKSWATMLARLRRRHLITKTSSGSYHLSSAGDEFLLRILAPEN